MADALSDPVPGRAASRTAYGVAALRAAHQVVDGLPRILEDPIAVRLLGWDADTVLARRSELDTPAALAWRSHVVLRSRYTEDRLEEAHARGVRQYVILGAGYDTFPYRQPAWAAGMRIFEVDQPASQLAKRDALAAASIPVPENVVFVPVNFETDLLRDSLRSAGFDESAPAFVSWLGVMVYVTEAAADDVFRFVASLPRSSEIVLTFSAGPASASSGEAAHLGRAAAYVASLGEPWQTFIQPQELSEKLTRFGFSQVTFLTPAESDARYFAGRSDALRPPRRGSLAAAIV
jgi:methyltransferase (TIGR00027 family)